VLLELIVLPISERMLAAHYTLGPVEECRASSAERMGLESVPAVSPEKIGKRLEGRLVHLGEGNPVNQKARETETKRRIR
jgi:hypothetical protein